MTVCSTHNEQKYEMLFKTLFADIESAAEKMEKSAQLLRQMGDQTVKLLVARNFVDGSCVKWNTSEDDPTTMINVINSIIYQRAHQAGREAGSH